jgi:hypothetical protein
MENQNLKWHQKPLSVVLLLIFFFPLGLYFMWKNKMWSKGARIAVTGIALFLIIISGQNNKGGKSLKTENLIGRSFMLDSYHEIIFKSENTYTIYQKPMSCLGTGKWSISGDKVVLSSNDSNCETTRKMKGSYGSYKFK